MKKKPDKAPPATMAVTSAMTQSSRQLQSWLIFDMGFFFLLAGYYTPSSYERKEAGRFLAERLLRLGVPLLVYFFALAPFTVTLARTSKGFAFWPGWWEMTRPGIFGPGPLWFAEALLLFAGGGASFALRPAPRRTCPASARWLSPLSFWAACRFSCGWRIF